MVSRPSPILLRRWYSVGQGERTSMKQKPFLLNISCMERANWRTWKVVQRAT